MPRPAWHTPPDIAARAWVAAAMGPGWRVERMRRLAGGIATAVDAAWLRASDGRTRELVLRRWLRPGWSGEAQAPTPAHEAAILDAVAAADPRLPVPHVVAVDPTGDAAGAPALLTDRLRGGRLTPAEERSPSRLEALGTMLARIHALPALLCATLPPFAPYYEVDEGRLPRAAARPDLWRRAIRATAGPPAPAPDTFLHRDFHPGNTLWTGARISGVVDWAGASRGPAAADLAHLRANLGTAHGIAVADAASAAYERAAGGPRPDQAWWDVRILLDFLDGPAGLRRDEVHAFEGYLTALLQRLDR